MKINILRFLLIGLSSILLLGCSTSSTPIKTNTLPSWVFNPNKDSKHGAVGICARTYDQKISTQRSKAIARALDELSLQMGVNVSLAMRKTEEVSNTKSSTTLQQNSSYKAKSNVNAHIEDIYMDKSSGELYVWMVLNK